MNLIILNFNKNKGYIKGIEEKIVILKKIKRQKPDKQSVSKNIENNQKTYVGWLITGGS